MACLFALLCLCAGVCVTTVRLHVPSHTPSGVRLEPGDRAPAFHVATLDGGFSYPSSSAPNASLIVHTYSHMSGFVQVLWSSRASLAQLVGTLPAHCSMLVLHAQGTRAHVFRMQEQLRLVAKELGQEDVLSRIHFSLVPLSAVGSWISSLFNSWTCHGHNCGLAQVVFTSPDWSAPLVSTRLDGRYDWLMSRWGAKPLPLAEASDGCRPVDVVADAVAWVSEGNCSFFTKVRNMEISRAVGVLVYALPGKPLQDMNCEGRECGTALSIPASMVHVEPALALALAEGKPVNVSFQTTPSPTFFFGIDKRGLLAEMGWFLYPSFSFVTWQAEWFGYAERLQQRLSVPVRVLSVFEDAVVQGDDGAVATVNLPSDLVSYDVLELDMSLSCPGKRDETCAHWDHTVQLYVCCDHFSSLCGLELGRWITAFRRGIGQWLMDVSPLLPLLNSGRCTFTMKTVPWAMPWVTRLHLRFSHSPGNYSQKLRPFQLMELFSGGLFDEQYNRKYQPVKFYVPPSTKRVELYAVITGHGSDDSGCCEFCITSHHFLINGAFNNSLTFHSAGTRLGCASRISDGVVPNQHGTWLYGRGGWCDGLHVEPWRVDVTAQLGMDGANTIIYFGLYDDKDPNPVTNPGYITMYSYLVFYK